jgi:hypothetical protein
VTIRAVRQGAAARITEILDPREAPGMGPLGAAAPR